RLARGRELLAQRLTRRGVALSAAGIATALGEGVALAALPSDLLGQTVTVADALVAKGTVVGVAAAEVSALLQQVMRSMLLTRLKITAAAALAVALLTAGGTALGYRALSNPAPAPTLTARTPLVFTEDLSRLGRHEVQVYAAVKPKAEELKWQQIP